MGCETYIPLVIEGGNGDDVLVAGSSDDLVSGGAGNDVLIGCDGEDQLSGDGGEDILIGGNTSWDEDLAALQAIIAEWGKVPPNQSSKVAHLTSNGKGGLNNPYKLRTGADGNVFDDAAVDVLTGGTGDDWFFRKTGTNADIISDTPELVHFI